MLNKKSPLLLAVLAATAATHAPTALSQESGFAIEEVVVTARKRAENLQEVPIAISAIDATTIERAGIERAGDYISLIPNVTLVDTANVGDTQVSIRGIVSTRDAESTFAYVVDGVLSTNPNSFNEELFDVEQIEVLKGPQGALYGRNAVSGAILVTTKKPGDEVEMEVAAGVGNEGAMKARAMISGPVADGVAGRIAVSTREFDGFYSNSFTGSDSSVDYLEDTSVRGRLIINASDDLEFDIRAGHTDVSGGAINFNAAFAIPAFEAAFGSPAFFADPNDLDFNFTFNVPGENEQTTTDFSIKADYAMDGMDLIASASYTDLEEYLLSDGTSATFYGYEFTPQCQTDRLTLNSFTRPDLFGPVAGPFVVLPSGDPNNDLAGVYGPYTPTACDGYQYQERNQQDISLDARLVSNGDSGAQWIVGAYWAKIQREVVVAYGADTGAGFLRQPYVAADGPNPTDLLFWDDFDTKVMSLYGQIEFDLSDTVELALAGRYDREKRSVSNRVPAIANSGLNLNLQNPPFSGTPGLLNAALAGGELPTRRESFTQFQPKATLSWAVSDAVNAYASYGVGFRSGGFNSVGTSATLNFWFNSDFVVDAANGLPVAAGLQIEDEYDKEVSTSVEAGIKADLMDGRLRFNAAVFKTDVEDNQFFEFFAGPFGLLRTVTTIDDLTISGFEADATYLATENLSLFGGIGLLDSEIERNNNRPLSVGNDVPQAPDMTANIGAQWISPMRDGMELVARVDYQYVGETFFHTLQDEQVPNIWRSFGFGPTMSDFSKSSRDAYGTLDARIGVESASWSVTLWGRNLTDEQYLQEIIPAPEFGGSFNHPSALRSYGLEATYRF